MSLHAKIFYLGLRYDGRGRGFILNSFAAAPAPCIAPVSTGI
jgi:hypothetical protein